MLCLVKVLRSTLKRIVSPIEVDELRLVKQCCNLAGWLSNSHHSSASDRLRAASHLGLEDLACLELLFINVLLRVIQRDICYTLSTLSNELF